MNADAAVVASQITISSICVTVYNALTFAPSIRQHDMTCQAWTLQNQPFEFDRHSVQLNSFYSASGAISFSGRWRGDGKRYSLTMSPQGHLAQVAALTESVDAALSEQKLDMSAVSAGENAVTQKCHIPVADLDRSQQAGHICKAVTARVCVT